jgi:hypothetical protein
MREPFGGDAVNQTAEVDLLWGGYYLSRKEGADHFSLFRILDFNRNAYHAALFREKLADVPSLDDVLSLTPFIGHAPIDARGLVRRAPLQLIGGAPLTDEDLAGYMVYLERHGVAAEERDELLKRAIEFSHDSPLGLRLTIVGDKLMIEEQE